MLDDCTTAQLYYDHYKDTFEQIRRYIDKRNRYTAYLILLLAVISLVILDANRCADIATSLLKAHLGVIGISFSVLNALSLFVLLYVLFGYYQVCLLIERSYIYLHNVENILSQMTLCNIDRESKSYLDKYPLVSNIASWFYTYVLPAVVIFVCAFKAYTEWPKAFVSMETLDFLLLLFSALVSCIYICDRLSLNRNYYWGKLVNFLNIATKNIRRKHS